MPLLKLKEEIRKFITDSLESIEQEGGTTTPDECLDLFLEELYEPSGPDNLRETADKEDPGWLFQVEMVISELREEYNAKS